MTIAGGGCDDSKVVYEIFVDGVRHVAAGKLALDHGISRDYIARLARLGKLRGRQFGTQWYIGEIAFKNFLVLREYQRAAHREQLAADRQREYHAAQAASSDGILPIAAQSPAPLHSPPTAPQTGLHFRLFRLYIHIHLDRAQRLN